MKVYKSFGSKETRDACFCRSQINLSLLKELGLHNVITVADAKIIFDNIKDRNKFFICAVGSTRDKTKRRHTKFVFKKVFFDEVLKGLIVLDKKQK